MSMKCHICSHNKKEEIEKQICSGVPHLKIGKTFGVSNMSVRNHARNHLSRQLLKSEETKSLLHGKNLFQNIVELIDRTKAILDDAESKDRPFISLGAIRELRQIYEFLIKFSMYLRDAQKEDRLAERERKLRDVKRLNTNEIQLLIKLIEKMEGDFDADCFASIK